MYNTQMQLMKMEPPCREAV